MYWYYDEQKHAYSSCIRSYICWVVRISSKFDMTLILLLFVLCVFVCIPQMSLCPLSSSLHLLRTVVPITRRPLSRIHQCGGHMNRSLRWWREECHLQRWWIRWEEKVIPTITHLWSFTRRVTSNIHVVSMTIPLLVEEAGLIHSQLIPSQIIPQPFLVANT